MAVPKGKTSKSRRDKRRGHHKMKINSWGECPNCKVKILPHTVCNSCGYYASKKIVEKES